MVIKRFRRQGIMGPRYSILSGSLDEMKKLRKAALETVLDTKSHDVTERVVPHCNIWTLEYGQFNRNNNINLFVYYYVDDLICFMQGRLFCIGMESSQGFAFQTPIWPNIYYQTSWVSMTNQKQGLL